MLTRINIRGKLLLLLATPAVAVLVFASTGVVDRLESRDFQERESRIASLADAGSDLSLAVQVERARGLTAESGAAVDLTEAESATNAAISRWGVVAEAARADIDDVELVALIDDLAGSLSAIGEDRSVEMSMTEISAELFLASRQVGVINFNLADQAADLDLFQALGEHQRVAQIQNAVAEITVLGARSIDDQRVPAVTATLLGAADVQIDTGIAQFLSIADDEYVEMLEQLRQDDLLPATDGESPVVDIEFVIDSGSSTALVDWLAAGEERLLGVNALSQALLGDAAAAAASEAAAAQDEARSFMVMAGSVILLTLGMAFVVGRSISRPLTKLTRNAEHLSTEELPALVESLRSSKRPELSELTPIDVKGRDEVAKLAGAISEIQRVTIDVAEEQGELLRRGISDIFVNLARRNQSLLDRQIDFIDQLEAHEEDPDQLENLFRLDHLATRMRRNAESLLVLSGAEPARRRGQPVEVADVVRVAMGEIEEYGRIRLDTIEAATVAGSVAVDLAHLLSELMENATQFSPPETGVQIVGHRIRDDSYEITMTDKGIGMSTEAVNAANTTFSEPPLVGLDLSRSLGFTVVSRLAHRLGVSVELVGSAQGGVIAAVTIPAEMVGEPASPPTDAAATAEFASPPPPEPEPEPEPAEEPADPDPTPFAPISAEERALAPAPGPSPEPMVDESEPGTLPRRKRPDSAPVEPSVATTPASGGDLVEVFSTPPAAPAPPHSPDADLLAPLDEGPAPLPRRTVTAPSVEPTATQPLVDSSTEAGLTRRAPRRVGVTEESRFAPGSQPVSTAAPTRSPEEVRQMLSRYRSGLRKGRTPGEGDDQPTSKG